MIVVIDPGHGGKDPGAVNKSIREKDIVLAIGLKLGKLINEDFPDVKVVFTRKTDIFIPLIERSRIANKNKANLFISLHANACPTPVIRGTETFFLGPALSEANLEIQKKENSVILLEEDYSATYQGFDPNSSESDIMFETVQSAYLEQSLYFANDIQHQFSSRIQSPNRGVKQAGFLVLKLSSMPSVLVETGFLSNNAEANYLNSEEGQKHIALSVFEAFKKFKMKSSGEAITKAPEIISMNKDTQKTTPVEVVLVENPKQEVKKQLVMADTAYNIEKPATDTKQEKEKPTSAVIPSPSENTNVDYFTVQIAANTKPVEPVAANFKGLKNVRREKLDQYYRYYVGNENSMDSIKLLLNQIKLKFPQAFIVSYVNGKRIPINLGSK